MICFAQYRASITLAAVSWNEQHFARHGITSDVTHRLGEAFKASTVSD